MFLLGHSGPFYTLGQLWCPQDLWWAPQESNLLTHKGVPALQAGAASHICLGPRGLVVGFDGLGVVIEGYGFPNRPGPSRDVHVRTEPRRGWGNADVKPKIHKGLEYYCLHGVLLGPGDRGPGASEVLPKCHRVGLQQPHVDAEGVLGCGGSGSQTPGTSPGRPGFWLGGSWY